MDQAGNDPKGAAPDATPDAAAAPPEPTMDELLDNMPEAVAMRRAREARAQAAARAGAAAAPPAKRSRRRAVTIGVLAFLMGARVFERVVRGGARN